MISHQCFSYIEFLTADSYKLNLSMCIDNSFLFWSLSLWFLMTYCAFWVTFLCKFLLFWVIWFLMFWFLTVCMNVHLIIKTNLISSFNFINIQSALDDSFMSVSLICALSALNTCILSTASCLFTFALVLYNLQQLILNSLLNFVRVSWFNILNIIIFASVCNTTDHFNSSVMYLFDKSSTFSETTYHILINLFS